MQIHRQAQRGAATAEVLSSESVVDSFGANATANGEGGEVVLAVDRPAPPRLARPLGETLAPSRYPLQV